MALDFLNTISQAVGPIQQILGAIRGPQKPKIQPQPAAEKYAMSLLRALADPGNSLLKSIQQEEFQNLRSGQQSDIKSKVLADRREQSMGRSPVFFDPERADENISYQISRGTPLLQQQAHQNAIQRILKAAGVGDYAGAESDRMQNYFAALGENEKTNALQGGITGRIGQTNDALQQILKIFQQGKPQFGPFQQAKPYNQMRYNA